MKGSSCWLILGVSTWLTVPSALLAQGLGGTGTGGGAGATGGTTGGTGTGTGGTGGTTGFGIGQTVGGVSTSNFLGTPSGMGASGGSFLSSGYGQGTLGHLSRGGSNPTGTSGSTFSRFYVNTGSLGLAGGTVGATIVPFGTPLYQSLYTGTGAAGAGRVGVGGVGGVGAVNNSFTPASVGGTRRPASYTTSVAFKVRPPDTAQLQVNLRQLLARSEDLGSDRQVVVALEDQTIVLRGTVATAEQRRLAENLVRLTPGVRGVRNELLVPETAPAPTPLP